MLRSMRWPSVVGKLVTESGAPWPSHPGGTPRPTTRDPSDRCATRESRSTLLAPAMPQACGEEPWPAAGMAAHPGERGLGALGALPPRQRTALAVGHHELVVQDPLISVAPAGQPGRTLCGVVGARVVVAREASGGVRREHPAQPVESVVVGGVDQRLAGTADGGSEERALPGPVADR